MVTWSLFEYSIFNTELSMMNGREDDLKALIINFAISTDRTGATYSKDASVQSAQYIYTAIRKT